MRLRREDTEFNTDDSLEYKTAVKSVIRCQIQSLLQKLAAETGDESIVISTNLSAGTYTHLGSYLGQEYLEDGDEYIQTICSRFSDFCAGLQENAKVYTGPGDTVNENQQYIQQFGRKTTPPSKQPNANTQKRQLTPGSPSKFSPPHKRKPTSHFTLENKGLAHVGDSFDDNQPPNHGAAVNLTRGLNSSHAKENNSSQSGAHCLSSGAHNQSSGSHSQSNVGYSQSNLAHSQSNLAHSQSIQANFEKKNSEMIKMLSSIKTEPVEDPLPVNGGDGEALDMRNKNGMSPQEQVSPQQGIVNRPRSLIPLANISKKFTGSRSHVKHEFHEEDLPHLDEHGLPSQDSILRSLYNQPIYGMESPVLAGDRSDSPAHASLSLPPSMSDSMDKYPASSENPVLAGYYDSDNYPRYRQSRKAPAKKSKPKEKIGANLSLNETPTTSSPSNEVRMRTFESGGRLVYACDVCKRELSHLTSYRRHMKLHTMERPHKCPVCGKGFIRKYHCIDHLNKHHKDVEFDAESLTLTGQSRGLYSSPTPSGDNTALSDTYSISPSEYNYTLDQSLDGDVNPPTNLALDQSASSILSELARSAAKQNQKDDAKDAQGMSPYTEKSNASTGELDVEVTEGKEADVRSENGKSADEEDNQSVGSLPSRKSSITDKRGYDSSPESKDGGSAMARKQEVSAGIKAIVAHLKSSSRRKKMLTEENEASKTKQVLEETN